ncbi:hypothetical protein DIPPA_10328 [Diplonema papillatum]|nr:hypothetical protein DIPPA_10328 [Diplonema papillatum]
MGAAIVAIPEYIKAGATALILTRHADVERLLLRTSGARAADVNAANNNGETALISASETGAERIVKELLSAGVDVNATTNDGTTALLVACTAGPVAIVKELLSAAAGANRLRRRR